MKCKTSLLCLKLVYNTFCSVIENIFDALNKLNLKWLITCVNENNVNRS